MKYSLLVASLLALLAFGAGRAAAQTPEAKGKDTCTIGMYILSIYDLDFPNEAFTSDFWLWALYSRDSLDPLSSAEITNAKNYNYSLPDVEKKMGVNWGTVKCKATIKQQWDVNDFPFDEQTLKIVIEDATHDTSSLVYVADTNNTKIDSSVKLNGWKISGFHVASQLSRYQTTYGDPSLGTSSTYPSVVATLKLKRDGLGLFFKLFTGVYVAFIIAIMVFFIDPVDVDPRFGLPVGAIFATVGNKYIVDSILPASVTFTLVDKIHLVTFIYILLTVVISVISLFLYKNGREAFAKKLDHYSFYLLLSTYILYSLFNIYSALT
ncbi:MAG: hypothetical protein ABI876_01795 [Bacteroidota bacterium]